MRAKLSAFGPSKLQITTYGQIDAYPGALKKRLPFGALMVATAKAP